MRVLPDEIGGVDARLGTRKARLACVDFSQGEAISVRCSERSVGQMIWVATFVTFGPGGRTDSAPLTFGVTTSSSRV
jgi:hypothetical protein